MRKWPMAPILKGTQQGLLIFPQFPTPTTCELKSPRTTVQYRALALITWGRPLPIFSFSLSAFVLLVIGPVMRECFWGGISIGPSDRCQHLVSDLWALGGGLSDYEKETQDLPFKSGQRTPEDYMAFLNNFSLSWSLALLTLVITSSECYFDRYSQRRICLRIKIYTIGQLSWSLVNNSAYLASWTITTLGSRFEFYKCNQKLAFPTCVLRLYRQGARVNKITIIEVIQNVSSVFKEIEKKNSTP